jgi:hypothetical protein
MGVTRKFAQIFFCEDKDLPGKRGKDPKNAYVTGVFGGRYFLKFFVALEVPSPNFSVEIPRDSNTLDQIIDHHHRFGGTSWICAYRCMRKIHCERTSLVYLEKRAGNSSCALRNKVSRHAHRRMRTASVCRSCQI